MSKDKTVPYPHPEALTTFDCPKCGDRKHTHRRRGGPYFEHERRCGACGHVWDPDDLTKEKE